MSGMKNQIQGVFMGVPIKHINPPHSVVIITVGGKEVPCRVWPWTDFTSDMLNDPEVNKSFESEEYTRMPKHLGDLEKIGVVVMLSDLSLDDIEHMSDLDFMRVFTEIRSITYGGGH